MGRWRNAGWLAAACLFVLFCAHPATAQNIKASLAGYVEDEQGRRISGAGIVIRNQETGLVRALSSDGAGSFHQAGLEPGIYQVSASKEAFAPFQVEALRLNLGQSLELRIPLTVAGVQSQVEVNAGITGVQLRDVKQSRSFNAEEMNGLPVRAGGQGRNFYAQALTAPGVAFSPLAHRPFAVSGQRPRNNNYLIDSAEMNDANSGFIAGRGVTEQLVSQEAVQGFEIITHNFKAEYGRNSGAIVSLVTKSGSEELHGSGYWYHNNSALSARNVFETRKSSQRSNLAGFTAGGPVRRNRAYFFANYEVFRPRGAVPVVYSTLTDEERSRAVPAVQPLVDLYPQASGGSRLTTVSEPRSVDQNTYLLRGDLLLNAQQTLMLRTSYTDGVTNTTGLGSTVASAVRIHNQTRSAAAHHTYSGSSGFLNELRFGYTRQTEDDAFRDSPLLGDPRVNGEVGFLIVPGLSPGGTLGFLGRSNFQNNYQTSDDITINSGRHVVKTGSSLRRIQVNGGAETSGFQGQLFFPNVDAFLAGMPLSYNRNTGNPMIGLRRWEWHSYVQDDWRVLPTLTLNLGVRYEWNTAPTEAADRIPKEYRFRGDRNNVAPRVGLAWNPARGTVVRAGYGVFYNAVELAFLGLTRFNPPLLQNVSAFRPQLPNLMDRAQTAMPSGLVIPDGNTRTPYAQHMNFSVERELWNPGSTLTVSYVGTVGRKLPRTRRPNGGENLAQDLRPDPTVGVVNRLETSASSNYHGLQAGMTQRVGPSMQLRLAYTWSRFIDDVSEIATSNQRLERNIIPLDEANLQLDRAVSDFHIPHVFAATWLYTPQLWRSHPILGGWTFSGITTLQSGRPYTIYSGGNNRSGSDNNRIHNMPGSLVRNPSSAASIQMSPGFTAAMLTPLAGTLGTLGRNTESTDGLAQINFSASKDFSLSETLRLQLRGEVFNLFNTANFDLVDAVASSPNFGRAVSAFDPRSAQLAVRLIF